MRVMQGGHDVPDDKGVERIVHHVNAMMGASIAVLTAFVVTDFTIEPQFVLWLAPTVLISPTIALWTRKLRAGKKVAFLPYIKI